MLIDRICENCQKTYKCKKGWSKGRFCSSKCWYEWAIKHPKPKVEITKEKYLEIIKRKFEEKVIKKEGCWDWKSYCDPWGYPRISIGRKEKIRGHQASWLLHKGNLEKGKYICHHCDNPRCTNPDHLFIGTPKDNVQDMIIKGRNKINLEGLLRSKNSKTTSAKGSENGTAVLDEKKVKEIKKMLSLKIPCTTIAKKFGVGTSTIHRIKHGINWTHVK